ncbi:MAG TPA: PGPGW domain-containing protein [Nitrospiraceae bacterium]|jgi:hypothetical protein|nr:PGPGW domain-containing protein [Nitrospiraceae bacterium]
MEALLSKDILSAMVIVSVVGFIGSLVAIPLILVRLPPHYFDERHPRKWMEHHHPALRLIGHMLKNVAGFVLLAAGIAMLVLPGQGILTMLIGISLVDFPGKRQLERKLIGQPAVLNTINKVREKFGRPPLTVAHHS